MSVCVCEYVWRAHKIRVHLFGLVATLILVHFIRLHAGEALICMVSMSGDIKPLCFVAFSSNSFHHKHHMFVYVWMRWQNITVKRCTYLATLYLPCTREYTLKLTPTSYITSHYHQCKYDDVFSELKKSWI